jgi:hypothetical protein
MVNSLEEKKQDGEKNKSTERFVTVQSWKCAEMEWAMSISKKEFVTSVVSAFLLLYYVDTYERCTMENRSTFAHRFSTDGLWKIRSAVFDRSLRKITLKQVWKVSKTSSAPTECRPNAAQPHRNFSVRMHYYTALGVLYAL